jgi:hypothetical protein
MTTKTKTTLSPDAGSGLIPAGPASALNELLAEHAREKDMKAKRVTLAQTAVALAMGYGVEVKIAPAENGGIALTTRRGTGRRYRHGLFGTDASAAIAAAELGESFGLQYGK